MVHSTIEKTRGIEERTPDKNHRYSITDLTAEEMKIIWHALSVYEGLLRDRT
ncbi:MAG: hypothetical protein LUD72_06590 [Bacteroidales bacterium]|nr:hypothetical protein [Bacteroidales bacterium]